MVTFNLSPSLRAWIDGRTETASRRDPPSAAGVILDFPAQGNILAEFETDEQARAEDETRAKRLAWVRPLDRPMSWTNMGPKLRLAKQVVSHLRPPTMQVESVDALAAILKAGIAGLPSQSLGSAVTMRTIRQTVFGAMFAAFEDYPDEALRTVTVINERWTFSPATLDGITAKKIKSRFRADLNRIGLMKMAGPFIVFLHGEFEPASGLYVLHFHILTTVEKAQALKRLKKRMGYVPTASGAAPIFIRRVRDRQKQFSYLLKAYWPARTIRWIDGAPKRDRGHHRIPEPFASQVLLWLDRQRLRDLTIMNDCWSVRNGGTEAMKRLYLSVMGPW